MKIKTMSHCQGKGSISHNNRSFTPKNVDVSRMKDNITFIKEPIAEAYNKIFGAAIERYNAKQKRADRRIETGYFEHVFNHAPSNHVITSPDKRNSFYEDLVQIGDKDDSGCGTPDGELVAECLTEYALSFAARNPNFYIFNLCLHKDEATPHLHIDYIPIGHYKRGVDTQNGLSQALKEMGFTGIDAINKWRISERKVLRKICNARGIGIKEPEKSRGSFAVEEYKAYKDNISELQSQVEKESEHLENLAQQAEFSAGHVEYLDKEIDEKSAEVEQLEDKSATLESAINNNTAVINQQSKRIESDKAELDKIARKKADVKAVENIEVKQAIFGDKVTVSTDDFNNLQTLAKKQIASVKTTKKLRDENATLKQENQTLSADNAKLKAQYGKTIHLTMENEKLKNEVGFLKNSLAKIMEFIERFNLKERLDLFLNPPERRLQQAKNKSQGEELL